MAFLQARLSTPMATVETSLEIEAPPEAVWTFISDLERTAEWVTFTDEMLEISEGETDVGTTYREYGGVGPKKGESTWRVTAFDPPRKQVHEGDLGVMQPHLTMRVEPRGQASLLTHRVRFRFLPKIRPIGWILERLFVERAMRKGLQASQRKAKEIIEAEAGPKA